MKLFDTFRTSWHYYLASYANQSGYRIVPVGCDNCWMLEQYR